MAFKKGMQKKGGRKKGVQNKVVTTVKESIQNVYARLGGDEAFSDWAMAERTEFYKIFARLIPQDQNLTGNITININKNVD